MKKLFVIILSFNGGQKIISCVKSLSLIKVPNDLRFKILIVDNQSTDGSINKIKKLRVKGIKVVENQKNLGFAAGNNVGIKYALKNKANYVLLLNQDTIVSENFLYPLLKNTADIISPVIKFRKNNLWLYDFGGRINYFLGRTRHLEISSLREKLPSQVDYVSGCCMLIITAVFRKIGILDERYFLYFEDVDFCLRARSAGFKIGVEPKSIIWHKLKATEEKTFEQNRALLKSNLIFIHRYLNWLNKPLAYFYWLLVYIKVLYL